MKCVTIVVDAGFQDIINDAIKNVPFESYLIIPKTVGIIGNSEPLMDSHIFPGYMVTYMIYIDNSKFDNGSKPLQDLKEILEGKCFRMYIQDVEAIIPKHCERK